MCVTVPRTGRPPKVRNVSTMGSRFMVPKKCVRIESMSYAAERSLETMVFGEPHILAANLPVAFLLTAPLPA
jgi:hypothetical protein